MKQHRSRAELLRLVQALRKLVPGIMLLCMPMLVVADDSATDEYKIKTALVYKLTKFIEWPDNDDHTDSDSFGICVMGTSPFEKQLAAIAGLDVKDVPISTHVSLDFLVIQKYCKLVLVGDTKGRALTMSLSALQGLPILTVGEHADFLSSGGMLRLYVEDNRLRIEVNVKAVESSGIRISSKLLRLSKIYKPEGSGDQH